MIQRFLLISITLLSLAACRPAATPTPAAPAAAPSPTAVPVTATEAAPTSTLTAVPPTTTPTKPLPTPTFTPLPPTATPTAVPWTTSSVETLELQHPGNWQFGGPDGMECAGIYEFFPTSLRLLHFSACWKDHVGGEQLTFAETYHRFRAGFTGDAQISNREVDGLQVELIQYQDPGSNGIIKLNEPAGTLALWQHNDRGWALIDQGNHYQADNTFERILESVSFVEGE